jgi:hypothetical protein
MLAYEYTGYRDSAGDGKKIILRIFPVILSEINFATHALCIQHSLFKLSEFEDFNRTATVNVDCDECSRGIDKE